MTDDVNMSSRQAVTQPMGSPQGMQCGSPPAMPCSPQGGMPTLMSPVSPHVTSPPPQAPPRLLENLLISTKPTPLVSRQSTSSTPAASASSTFSRDCLLHVTIFQLLADRVAANDQIYGNDHYCYLG